jgi:hypothetical protein
MTVVVHRLSKFLLPFTCACALVGAAVPASAAAKLAVGISDQNPVVFAQPKFLNVNLTVARYFAPWNTAVEKSRTDLNNARAWINDALAAGVQPMISFGGNGNYIPSVAQYSAAIKKFIKDFPKVRTYAAWNEPDWIYRPKLANNPGLAASYFNALHQACPRCTDVAGEVYLPANQLGSYLRAYARGLHYRPSAWALHNYYDVRTHTTSQLRVMESLTSGPIWLTEIAGIERRGHWQYRNQSVFAAAKDESFLFSLPKRFPRVTRIYHYDWYGTDPGPNSGWDSGLVGPLGVPRPAYWVVAKAAGPRPVHAKRHSVRRA